MKHTEKMILIPAEISERTKPIDVVLESLDNEMQKVLNSKNIPSDLKLIKYNQILGKFKRLHEQKQEPYKANIIEHTKDVLSNDEILTAMPKNQIPKAKMLLHYIRTNPFIEIESDGELVIDGQKIEGSNITDLINDLARERKKISRHPGTKELLKVLNRTNVPLASIGNRQGREIFAAGDDFDWDESL